MLRRKNFQDCGTYQRHTRYGTVSNYVKLFFVKIRFLWHAVIPSVLKSFVNIYQVNVLLEKNACTFLCCTSVLNKTGSFFTVFFFYVRSFDSILNLFANKRYVGTYNLVKRSVLVVSSTESDCMKYNRP